MDLFGPDPETLSAPLKTFTAASQNDLESASPGSIQALYLLV